MKTKHIHRPSFWGFLFGKQIWIKGRRISIFRCSQCGARLRIIPSQQEFHHFLPAIPLILSLFACLILIYLGARTTKGTLIAAGILLIAYFFQYAIAYRFTSFEEFPDEKEKNPGK